MIGRSSSGVLVRAANLIGAFTVAVVLCAAPSARAWDETKYPNFGGQWKRPPGIGNQFDQTKPPVSDAERHDHRRHVVTDRPVRDQHGPGDGVERDHDPVDRIGLRTRQPSGQQE